MGKRAILLCLLGLSLLQLLTGVFAQKCEKRIWRKIGLTGYVNSCRYLCKGLPPKIGYEADGAPCKKLFRAGACKNGNCVTNVPPDPTLQKPTGAKPTKNSG